MRVLIAAATLLLVGCGCSTQDSLDVRVFSSTWSHVSIEYRQAVAGKALGFDADQVKARLMWCDEADAVVARRSGK